MAADAFATQYFLNKAYISNALAAYFRPNLSLAQR
jgi:hypothetical protein